MERAATFDLQIKDKALAATSNGAMAVAVEAGPAQLFFIDRQGVERDCICKQLASLLSDWRVEPMSETGELLGRVNWAPSSVLILNVRGKSMSTPEVAVELAMLAKVAPAVPVLIMSELCEASEVILAFGLGARGYLPTSLAISEMTAIVRLVAEGGTYVPAIILGALFETHRSVPAAEPCGFSPRQLQVLERLSEGKRNKMIACELGIAESTVKVHIHHLMKKLNARNRTQVVLITKNGLQVRSAPVAA